MAVEIFYAFVWSLAAAAIAGLISYGIARAET
jgi:hypothetical protein